MGRCWFWLVCGSDASSVLSWCVDSCWRVCSGVDPGFPPRICPYLPGIPPPPAWDPVPTSTVSCPHLPGILPPPPQDPVPFSPGSFPHLPRILPPPPQDLPPPPQDPAPTSPGSCPHLPGILPPPLQIPLPPPPQDPAPPHPGSPTPTRCNSVPLRAVDASVRHPRVASDKCSAHAVTRGTVAVDATEPRWTGFKWSKCWYRVYACLQPLQRLRTAAFPSNGKRLEKANETPLLQPRPLQFNIFTPSVICSNWSPPFASGA